MEILTQWVTQIIIFLLLASIVDLLIPATSMKKYIKLVVGLILILIFLKPLFFLFDFNAQQALEKSYSQIMNQQPEGEQVENSIKMQKSEIQESQNAYILEQTVVQLKELAKKPLQEDYQLEISDIEFPQTELFAETELTDENFDEVIVYLDESSEGEGEVSAIEDVVINTDKTVANEVNKLDVNGIKLLLQDTWEIDNKKLTILWEGGTP
ncbi:stage III sporulation protein AF [Virgibacillus subterraneus]|uniref:Stage III sporulation protein AF n=2 Tax=Virgibacillus TaxID=84406 RepID=A0A1H1BHP6_9BACI|nr:MULTISPECIES: stage III sporulation protein AF [Virgibacillus]SDQ51391.1 stage III sporulation protein AF [Virgibacillus salinus]SEQ20335.1 stage III sporulation protein AF [Virgibacillus subterraneus]